MNTRNQIVISACGDYNKIWYALNIAQNNYNLQFEYVNQVNDVRGDISQIGFDLDELQRMVSGLVSFTFMKLFVSFKD